MKITYKGKTKECKYYKGLKWNKPLTSEMLTFEKETGKKAIRGGIITGTFEYWMYWDPKQNKVTTNTKLIQRPTPKPRPLQNPKPNYNTIGYRTISTRKEVMNGIKVEIQRVECGCCKGILDFYYLDDKYSIPQTLKIVVVKEGPNFKKKVK